MMAEYELGKWDLSELAKNPKSPAFQKQIKDLENQARKFEKIKTYRIEKHHSLIHYFKMLSHEFKVILKLIK